MKIIFKNSTIYDGGVTNMQNMLFDGASLSSLTVSESEIEEAFASVEPKFIEILKKAAKNIPVSRLEDFLDYVKACDNAEIELNICEDGSVKVSSNSDLSVGTPRRNLRNFTILKSGEIEGGFGSLNSEAWQKFQSFLA